MTILLRRKGMVSGKVIAEGLGIQCVRNDRPIPATDTVIRWGCTTRVQAEREINTAQAVSQVSDKKAFRKILEEQNLCPKTWFEYDDDVRNYVDGDGPVIVRPAVHSKGRHTYLCSTVDEVLAAMKQCGPDYYISEYVKKVAEYRVFIAQQMVAWVARKTPANPLDVVWNVDGGGRFDNVRWKEWSRRVCEVASVACGLADLHFGAVDVMVDADSNATVLEINTAPALTTPYRTESTIKVLRYMLEVNDTIELPANPDRRGYGRYIHPALEQ